MKFSWIYFYSVKLHVSLRCNFFHTDYVWVRLSLPSLPILYILLNIITVLQGHPLDYRAAVTEGLFLPAVYMHGKLVNCTPLSLNRLRVTGLLCCIQVSRSTHLSNYIIMYFRSTLQARNGCYMCTPFGHKQYVL